MSRNTAESPVIAEPEQPYNPIDGYYDQMAVIDGLSFSDEKKLELRAHLHDQSIQAGIDQTLGFINRGERVPEELQQFNINATPSPTLLVDITRTPRATRQGSGTQ
jgi:hypothetical protein